MAAKPKTDPVEQKAKLMAQLKTIESKIAQFDEVRASKVASLAKHYRLIDLSDAVLEKEFARLRDQYHIPATHDKTSTALDGAKKN